MDEEKAKQDIKELKEIKQELIDNYEKIDKSYSRNLILDTFFFLIIIIILLFIIFK